eukprot:1504021-Pyramimonas_sp.AAC.1
MSSSRGPLMRVASNNAALHSRLGDVECLEKEPGLVDKPGFYNVMRLLHAMNTFHQMTQRTRPPTGSARGGNPSEMARPLRSVTLNVRPFRCRGDWALNLRAT